MPSVCKSATFVGKDVVGDASDGWWIVGGGFRDLASPGEDDNPYVVWARELLADAGYDYKISGFYGVGLAFGWSRAQVYMVAGQLDGRPDPGQHDRRPAVLGHDPGRLPVGHQGQHERQQGRLLDRGLRDRPVRLGHAAVGPARVDIIELSGKSKTCAWNQTTSTCN